MKVLIITVGKTKEPLEFSIAEHVPQGVVFVASQESYAVAGDIIREYGEGFLHHTVLLEDAEDLVEAYRKVSEAYKRALEWEPSQIIADLTGATKPMAAGLVLALAGRGVSFSYVGGAKRDPTTGRVISGTERLRILEDPSVHLGVLQWERFTQAWDALNLTGALTELDALLDRPLPPSERRFYQALKGVVEGLIAWDRFRHGEALTKLGGNLRLALGVAEAWMDEGKARSLRAQESLPVLQALEGALSQLKAIQKQSGRPSFPLVQDLMANAERRAQLGRYDDALARLYRALELTIHTDIWERLGLDLKDPKSWPEGFPASLKERVLNPKGFMEFLEAALELDRAFASQDTLVQRMAREKPRLQNLLDRRHQSILAHGTRPVDREDYEALRDFMQGLDPRLKPSPLWPRFRA